MLLSLLLGFLQLRREYFFRIIILGVSGLTGFTLILTYARGIWVALVVMLLISMLIRLDWKILATLIILAITISGGMAFSDRLTDKITSLKSPFTEPNMIGRYQIWKDSLNIIKDRPILGIGLKTYGLSQVVEKYHLSTSTHAHNM
jgi:O-antigen ligase